MSGLWVGQKLWFVPAEMRWRKPEEVTVAKVGRKWAELAERQGKIALDTLEMDGAGYSSPGRCYLSRDVWEAEVARREAWGKLRRKMEDRWNRLPEGVTLEAVQQAAALLRLDIS